MTERRCRWFSSLATLAALCPAAAQAQSTPALLYRAPTDCPTREQFGAEVAARLGRVAFSPEADERMEVEILAAGDRWLATLSLGSPSMRAFRDEDCAALVRTVATAAAVLLDPGSDDARAATGTPDGPDRNGASEERGGDIGSSGEPTSRTEADPADERARVVVRADQPGLTLHVARRSARTAPLAGMTEFERLCTAPCETRLEPGVHHFAVSEGVGTAVSTDELVAVSGDSRLTLGYEDRTAWQWVGGAVAVVGFVAALGATVWGADRLEAHDGKGVAASLIVGVGGLAAYIVGMVLVFDDDDATVQVEGPL